MIFNAVFIVRVTRDWRISKFFWIEPEALTLLHSMSFLIAIFAGFVALLFLIPTLMNLFGVQNVATTILSIVASVFYAGIIIGVIIAELWAEFEVSKMNAYTQESRSLNHSNVLLQYWLASEQLHKGTWPTAAGWSVTPNSGQISRGDFCLHEWLGVTWAQLKQESATKFATQDEGLDWAMLGYMVYTAKFPLPAPANFSQFQEASDFWSPVNFDAHVAYGVSVEGSSLSNAISKQDVCYMTFKAKGTAPGWSVSALESYYCNQYQACLSELTQKEKLFEDLSSKWCPNMGGKVVSRKNEWGATIGECELPKDWNRYNDALAPLYWLDTSVTKDAFVGVFTPNETAGIYAYYQANLLPILIAGGGIFLLIIGLIAGCVASGDDD